MLLARTPSLVSYLPMPIDIAARRWRPRPRLHVRVHVLLRPGDASVGDGVGEGGTFDALLVGEPERHQGGPVGGTRSAA